MKKHLQPIERSVIVKGRGNIFPPVPLRYCRQNSKRKGNIFIVVYTACIESSRLLLYISERLTFSNLLTFIAVI